MFSRVPLVAPLHLHESFGGQAVATSSNMEYLIHNLNDYMTLDQKKFATNIVLDLKDDFLYYKIKDRNGSNSMNILYEDITNDVTEFEERNQWYRNVGLVWVALGLIDTFIFSSDGIKLSIWLVLGIVFYGLYYFYKISFTKIDATSHNIFIIKNNKHDEIIKKLFDFRNDYLRTKYAKIDTTNDIQNEINKFKWLKNVGVITQSDFDDFEKAIKDDLE